MRAQKLRLLVAALTLSCAPTRSSRVEAPPQEQKATSHEVVEKAPEPEPVQEETTVEGARERITGARANLDGAVADLKKQQPDEADLAAAKAAADALKAAIEAGGKLESKDLSYAKFALEARRALRTQREVIDRRWVEVGVEKSRLEIDGALVDLKGAVDRLQSKDVAEEDFALARTAADAVKAALDRGQPMVSKSSKFRTWVASVKTKLATHKRTIDDREIKVLVERQRALVEEGRRALTEALAQLKSKEAADPQFEAAKAAVDHVQKLLDGSAAVTKKSGPFAKYVLDVKRSLGTTRTGIDKRKLELQVEAQRARVDEARGALAAVLAGLKAKDVADEKFEEAKTALTVLSKTLDQSVSLSAKDGAFGRYVSDTRRTLDPTKKQIEERRLAVAIHQQRVNVTQAVSEMKRSLARLPTAEEVGEAEASINLVEKTIQAGAQFEAKDAIYAGFANEAKKATTDGRTRIGLRKDELAMDAQKIKVESELENLKGAVALLDGLTKQDPAFQVAVEATKRSAQAIDSGAELEKKLPRYASWAAQARKRVGDATKRIEKRKLEVAVIERKSLVDETLAIAKGGLETVKEADSTGKDVADAVAKLRAVRESVTKGVALEPLDGRYAAHTTNVKKQIEKLQAELDEAKHVVAFREGPVKALVEGEAVAESVADSMGLEQRRNGHAKALALFQKCEREGNKMIEDHPHVGTGRAKNVITDCSEQANRTEAKLNAVKAVLAFYDGPAKSFERAIELGKSGKSTEALAQFESCLEKGKVLSYKHPELNKQQFDVAGRKTTLAAVVAECQKEAKTLRVNVQHAKK